MEEQNQQPQQQYTFIDTNDEEKSSDRFVLMVKYYFIKIWPTVREIIAEIIHYSFKAGRSLVKFALVQIGLKR